MNMSVLEGTIVGSQQQWESLQWVAELNAAYPNPCVDALHMTVGRENLYVLGMATVDPLLDLNIF
jgi:hypothetical protein